MGTLFYAGDSISFLNLRFENDVKMYGTQAGFRLWQKKREFENDVKTYGTKAYCFEFMVLHGIANGVIVLTRLFPVDLTGNIDIFRWEKGQYRNITQCIALFGRVYQMAKSIRIRM